MPCSLVQRECQPPLLRSETSTVVSPLLSQSAPTLGLAALAAAEWPSRNGIVP